MELFTLITLMTLMTLSPEDNLRLNVLLANNIQAIRIDESKMIVYGLTERGEAKVQLHSTCRRDEQYLRQVKELIANNIKTSSGVYPLYLTNWNYTGQVKDEHLAQWLMLGEPEAVIAVMNAPGLTTELARRAWWAMPNAANARSLLKNEPIAQSELAKELAQYLLEYLPFEEEAINIIESVRLMLQPGLIEEEMRQQLWRKGQTKNAYLVGFLWAQPDALPNPLPARTDANQIQTRLAPLIAQDNMMAKQLVKITSAAGQTFLETCERVLRKPANQDVVNTLFAIIADYFSHIRPKDYDDDMNIFTLIERATHLCDTCLDSSSVEQRAVLTKMPEMQDSIRAMLILSGLISSVLRPIFSRTTVIGSLMRKKLVPITTPIFEQFAILRQSRMTY